MALVISLVSGCSTNSKIELSNSNLQGSSMGFSQDNSLINYDTSIRRVLVNDVHSKLRNLTIVYSKDFSNGYISQFLFSINGNNYEGDDFAIRKNKRWHIVNIAYGLINKKYPFTRMELGGTYKKGNQYMIISGVRNNRSIAYIDLAYIDGLLVRVMKAKNSDGLYTYAYARTDSQIGVKYIYAYDNIGKKVYGIQ